jgi:glycosyltransferase involved in cell wall biosynthesis
VAAISVVIPTYNRSARLSLTLGALSLQDCGVPFEVLVCDDGSDDDTPEVAERMSRSVPYALRYFRREHDGWGANAARNLGIAAATGEMVLFLDDDMLASPGLLRAHRRDSGPEVVTIGYRYYLGPGGLPLGFQAGYDRRERYFLVWPDIIEPLWSFAEGCNIAVGRELLERAGGFDESFKSWGGSDLEFALRLHLLGGDLRLCRGAFAWHQLDPDPASRQARLIRGLPADFTDQLRTVRRIRDKFADVEDVRTFLDVAIGWLLADEQRAGEAGALREPPGRQAPPAHA